MWSERAYVGLKELPLIEVLRALKLMNAKK